jgi:hypothetical protein
MTGKNGYNQLLNIRVSMIVCIGVDDDIGAISAGIKTS